MSPLEGGDSPFLRQGSVAVTVAAAAELLRLAVRQIRAGNIEEGAVRIEDVIGLCEFAAAIPGPPASPTATAVGQWRDKAESISRGAYAHGLKEGARRARKELADALLSNNGPLGQGLRQINVREAAEIAGHRVLWEILHESKDGQSVEEVRIIEARFDSSLESAVNQACPVQRDVPPGGWGRSPSSCVELGGGLVAVVTTHYLNV